MSAPVLDVRGLTKHFRGDRGATIHAVNGVSFSLQRGETLALVGESGSGKTTIGRTVLRLLRPTSGTIEFDGIDITSLPERACRKLRDRMQMVFQDPWSALNPRMSMRALIEEPLILHTRLSRAERRDRADALATRVHLPLDLLRRTPSDLSGGQLQRVCIARAIATNPKFVVLDEPTSSLDLSVRAGILELLAELRRETGVSLLFISHDLATVRLISDRVLVLYLGAIVEQGLAADVFARPAHPYTQALLSAHLPADPRARLARHVLQGEIPSPIDLPPGCHFSTRCPAAMPECARSVPEFVAAGGDGQLAACIRVAEFANRIMV